MKLTLYHGTRAQIDEIRPSKDGGIYLTDDLDEAAEFAQFYGGTTRTKGEPRILVVELSLKNPLNVDAEGELFEPAMTDRYIAQAKNGGHDGVIVRNIRNFEGGKLSTTYIAFSTNQVRIVGTDVLGVDWLSPAAP